MKIILVNQFKPTNTIIFLGILAFNIELFSYSQGRTSYESQTDPSLSSMKSSFILSSVASTVRYPHWFVPALLYGPKIGESPQPSRPAPADPIVMCCVPPFSTHSPLCYMV